MHMHQRFVLTTCFYCCITSSESVLLHTDAQQELVVGYKYNIYFLMHTNI